MTKRFLLFGLAALTACALALPGTASADKKAPWIHISVLEDGGDKAKVDINLPLSLVEVALEVAEDEMLVDGHIELDNADVSVADLRRMWHELRDAGDGDFVTVEEDDETVRIFRKGKYLYVEVDDSSSRKDEKVRMEIPITVVDALFEGEEEGLNLRAALAELQRTSDGEILSIQDGGDHVRIWID